MKENTMSENNQLKSEEIALGKAKKQEDFTKVNFFKLLCTFSNGIDMILMIFGTIGAIAMGGTFPVFILIFGKILNNFGDFASPTELRIELGNLALIMGGIGIAMGVATFMNTFFWEEVGSRISTKIRIEYFKALLRQEQSFYDSRNAYEFSTKVESQLKSIGIGIGGKVGQVIVSFSMFVGAYIVGFITNWKLSLVLLGLLPLLVIGGYCMTKILTEYSQKSSAHFDEAGGVAEEVLYNIKTVASFANLEYEQKRFNALADKALERGKYGGLYSSIASGFTTTLKFCSYTVAIGYGGYLISQQEINNNTGEVFRSGDICTVLFCILLGSFSLGQSAPNIKAIATACGSAREFFYLVERKPDIDYSRSVRKPDKETLKGKITFEDVSFAYPSKRENPILQNLSLDFQVGEVTAIVGESGSGKSTIVNLLERLYDVDSGKVSLDGINIKELDLAYYRSLIGYVPQEPVLFNTSLRDNIIFGRENVTEEEINEACELALVSQFTSKLENGLDSKVGIKGGKLSGGQKQRVAIARAILKRPKLLILDEATSALDYKSEKLVKMALDRVSDQRTTIVIAHRLSTIRNADKIVVLEKGKIAEIGNHESLYDLGKLYYCLVKNQQNDGPEAHESINEEKSELVEIPEEEVQKKEEFEDLTFEERKRKLLEADKIKEKKIADSKKKLWPFVCESPATLVTATIFACLDGAIWPCYGYLLAECIFVLSETQDLEKLADNSVFLAMMFLVVAFAAGITNFFVSNLFNLLGESLARSLRIKCYDKYLRLHMGFYDVHENSPGTLLTKLSSDTLKVNGVALSMFAVLIETTSTLLLGIILGFVFCWELALVSVGLVPLIILSSVFSMKIKVGFLKNNEVIERSLGAILSECVVNTKTIYCFNMQNRAIEMYIDTLKEISPQICTKIVACVIAGFSQFTMFLVNAIIFYLGAVLIEKGRTDFNYMLKSIFSILFAAFGLGSVQMYIGDYTAAKEALYSLFTVIETPSELDPYDNKDKIKINPETFTGRIDFKDVCFSYPTRKTVQILRNLNFSIEPNQSVAFVGFSGSGKSSIFQLLFRFYDPDSGQILIDGEDIKNYDILSLRKMFGIVMQEPVLFKTNIYNNILYGDLDLDENLQHERILECARAAQIKRIENISKENKDALPVSGGEKQRIAIARCMLRNPKILCLDEATSALDKNIENEIQISLNTLMEKRTSLVIAHRMSTIEKSDCIYFLENGQIKESGNHEKLMSIKGKYFSLYNAGNKNQ